MFQTTRFKIVAFTGAFVVLALALLIVTGVISPLQDRPVSGSAVVWVFSEYDDALQRFAANHRAQFPSISVKIESHARENYELDLLNALAANKGPDVFMIDKKDLPRFFDKILPLASDSAAGQEFKSSAADAVIFDLVNQNGEVLGVPVFFDTLALYYNRDFLNTANFPSPPQTWEEFRTQSTALMQRSPSGAISRSGASLGTAANVSHFSDIFEALVLQSGNPIINPETRQVVLDKPEFGISDGILAAVSALRFYTSFANPLDKAYTWNTSLPNSLEAFALGRAAFYIGYARDLQLIVRANPHLNFRVAELPQLIKGEKKSVASYPVLVVSRLTKDPAAAWAFANAGFSPSAQKFISDALGAPSARRDLISAKPANAILQPFYNQVLSARSWPSPSGSKVRSIFREMIEAVNRGQLDTGSAIERASSQLKFLISGSQL